MERQVNRKTRTRFAVAVMAVLSGSVVIAETAESTVAEMDTVGGRLKLTREEVDGELPLHKIYLNGSEVYSGNDWNDDLDKKFKISNTDVIVVSFASGANTECVEQYGVLGVRPNRTAYWLVERLTHCDATFEVVGDKLVATDVTHEGRRSKTVKTLISLDGMISHAR